MPEYHSTSKHLSANCHVLLGSWQGKKAWYRIQLSSHKRILLENVISQRKEINLQDYGQVIESGWGEPV